MTAARAQNPIGVDDQLLQRLEQERQRDAALRAQAAGQGQVADQFANLRRTYPWMPPGATLSLAQGGVPADSPAAQAVAQGTARKKAAGGLGFDPPGTPTSPRKRKPGLRGVFDEGLDASKAIVRGVTTGLQSGLEEAQGAIRNVAAYHGHVGGAVAGAATGAAVGSIVPGVGTAIGAGVGALVGGIAGYAAADQIDGTGKWETQSSGGIALEKLARGEKVNLGSGWLANPHTDIAEEQKQRARRVQIAGHSLTPGRLLASGVVEPGTDPYNTLSGLVDASLALSRYDPGGAVLREAGNANRARKLLTDEAGMVDGVRKAVNTTKAEQWWYGNTGRKLAEKFASADSFDEIWRATDKKLDVRTVLDLVDAKDVNAVDDVLLPKLGTDIREKFGYRTFRPTQAHRLLGGMPGMDLDITDPNNAVEQIDRFLRNAKVPDDKIAGLTEQMARATRKIDKGRGRPAAYEAVKAAMDAVTDELVSRGKPAEKARQMTRLWLDKTDDLRHFVLNEVGDDMRVPGLVVGGKAQDVPHPALYVQYLRNHVPLPDAREIRTATANPVARAILENPAIEFGESVADKIMQPWKRAALLRAAYTVRVVGEEQARMAATGLDSMIHHPLSFLAWRLGRNEDVLGNTFEHADEAAGELDDFNKALNREWAGWVDQSRISTKQVIRFRKGVDEGFTKAWAGELLEARRDPVMRAVALADNGLDDVKKAFWNGELSFARRDMATDAMKGLRDRATSDSYIDTLADIVRNRTGGDLDLLDIVRTGKLDHILGKSATMAAETRPSKELLSVLDSYMGKAPEWVKGDNLVHAGKGSKVAEAYDNATRYLFSELMGERTNHLSRSPAFRQFYARRIEELLPHMTGDAQDAALEWARTNKLPSEAIKRMENVAASAVGDVKLDHADTIAKGFALDQTRGLLYDMTEKGQFFDATRLVFPFGEAWKEVVGRWLVGGDSILANHPQAIARRVPQVIQGARGQGFFRQNTNGEEVFTYPGSEFVTDKLLGVPVPLTGRVAGLSLMTEVLPGIGPVVSLPAGWIIPDTPQFDDVRNVIFPFGEQDTSGGFTESFLPAWVQKLRQATGKPADARLFGNTVQDVARYLASTGKYDTSTPDGLIQLEDDAKTKAKGLYALRSAAQFIAPSAPSPEFLAKDKNGQAMVAMVMIQDFHDMQHDEANGGYETAVERFLDKYGDNAFLLMQPKTNAVVANAPVTTDGVAWEKKHPDIARRYSNTYGFFAPAEEEFDFGAYSRTIESGKRQPLTPDQAIHLANARVAQALYDQAKTEVGDKPNAAARKWLREYRAALRTDYPGFDNRTGIAEQASIDTIIAELHDAVQDKRLAKMPVTKSIRDYLEARDEAQADSEAAGLASFKTAEAAKPLRVWLREYGDSLAAEDNQFARVWETLQREMPTEEEDA